MNGTSIPTSFSLSYSNVPVANNEWAIVDVVGYDGPNGTGSSVDLGQLAGFFNVASSPATATINASSTLSFQVAFSAIIQGIISTYDLQNETTLNSDMTTLIGSIAPSNTGLFLNSQLQAFATSLYQTYNRTITVTASNSLPAVATIVYNYTAPAEKDFVYNADVTEQVLQNYGQPVGSTQAGLGAVPFYVVGNPFSGFLQVKQHTPTLTAPAPQAAQVFADAVDASNGSVTVQHVYGGDVYIGMQSLPTALSTPPPFSGGMVDLGPRAAGSATSVPITVQTQQMTMTMVDPQAAAFGIAPYYSVISNAGKEFQLVCDYAGDAQCRLPQSAVSSISGSNVSVIFSAFNAFDLAPGSLQVCTGLDCFPLVANATNAVRAPFYDPGSNLQYYAWVAASPYVSSVTAVPSQGYGIAYSGGTTGGITSSTAAWFYPQQNIVVNSNAPGGTVWTVSLACGGQATSATGVVQGDGQATLYLTGIVAATQCQTTTLSYALPAGSPASGNLILYSLGSSPITGF